MALLRALRRALPPHSQPAAALLRRAPHPPPSLPPLRLLDPIVLRPFSAAATASQAPAMGASLFSGHMDTRFPKRRPGFVSRRKRASLRPEDCKPGEPIQASQPNAGSVQWRKEKKRIKQREAFVMAEKNKRKAQYSAAVKRGGRKDRKEDGCSGKRAGMDGKVIELKQLEEEKKTTTA